jgi:hypothetical protein
MTREEHYQSLLGKLEAWNDELANGGPNSLDAVCGRMHTYLEHYLEDLRPKESDPVMSVRDKIEQIKNQLTAETGAEPTAETIADEMGLPGRVKEIKSILSMGGVS